MLFRFPGCYSEGGFWDLGCDAEGAAEEFLYFAEKELVSLR